EVIGTARASWSMTSRYPLLATTRTGRRPPCSRPTAGSSSAQTITPGVISGEVGIEPLVPLADVGGTIGRRGGCDGSPESVEPILAIGEVQEVLHVLPERLTTQRGVRLEPVARGPRHLDGRGSHTRSIPACTRH